MINLLIIIFVIAAYTLFCLTCRKFILLRVRIFIYKVNLSRLFVSVGNGKRIRGVCSRAVGGKLAGLTVPPCRRIYLPFAFFSML